MKIKTRHILLIITTLIVVWEIIDPTALRSTIANNLWSVKFIRETYLGLPISPQLTKPPNTHKHAGLLLAHQALKDEQVELALDYLDPLRNSTDRLVLNTLAQIRYLNEDYAESLEIWKTIKDAGSLNFAGVGLAENGEIDLAILAYQYAYEIRPEKDIYRHRVVGYQAEKAYTLLDSNQLEEAIKAYKQIIAQYPDSGIPYGGLAQAYFRNNQSELAFQAIEQGWELNSENFSFYMIAARIYEQSVLVDEALGAYQKALTIRPNNQEALDAVERLSGDDE